jgi:NADPH-dependent 2,4-dienoyl-CoA reductase/sulfur reductase-like enzyme
MSDGRHLVIVGAGPAGLSAATAAAKAGLRVTLIDESDRLGGQYFRGRQSSDEAGSPRAFAAADLDIRVISNAAVIDTPEPKTVAVWRQHDDIVEAVAWDRLIIATGAYDRAVAIPGWTLPGVMGAGGASTLAKLHGVTPGKRVLVAGSGPFILAVADDLSAKGCKVEIVDAAPWSASVRGLARMARDPEIAAQAIGYLARLKRRGVRRRYREMVTAIHGSERVEAATVHSVDDDWRPVPGTDRTVAVDAVCLGYGFVPQLELAQALGCTLRRDALSAAHFVSVDEAMRTSVPGVYAAGEVTGTDGKRVAVAEGTLAGLAVANDGGVGSPEDHASQAAPWQRRLKAHRRVAEWIRQSFSPHDGLFALPKPDTIVCRCEDVRRSDMDAALAVNPATPYAVKTATRAGMGLCQGRICGPYIAEWLRAQHGYKAPENERPWRIRPPLRPVSLGAWLPGARP